MPRNSSVGSLNSWKQISQYLDRGVRTVQRWERDLGLPVHRVGCGPRSPVHAFPAELRAWLLRVDQRNDGARSKNNHAERSDGSASPLLTNLPSSADLLSARRQQAEALIAAVEALGRNEQVRRAAALIAGIDSVVSRKGSDGHHRLKQITRRRGGRKSRGVNAGD